MTRKRLRRGCNRSGAALVEMAVVFPLLLMLILGMVEVARLGMVAQLATTAARDGCRTAVLNSKTQTQVEARIDAVLLGGGIDTRTITYSPTGWTTVKASDANNFVTVTVSISYQNVTWLPMPWFLSNAQIVGSATLSSERQ